MNELEKAAGELLAYARENGWSPLTLRPPPPEAVRDFEHEGCEYRTTLSRLLIPDGFPKPQRSPTGAPIPEGKAVYLLSVTKRNAVPDANGFLLPTGEEGAEIAAAFFPLGFAVMPSRTDPLKGSLKYFALV